MTIRQLSQDDRSFLRNALYHAIHVAPGEAPPPLEILEQPELGRYIVGWMQEPDDLGFLAEIDGKAIGAAWVRRWPGRDRGYGFVDSETPELSMSVLPEYRGRGIGTKLLRRLLSATQERFAAVSLSVSVENPARRLYEREGFVAVSSIEGGSITMLRRAPLPHDGRLGLRAAGESPKKTGLGPREFQD